MVKASKSLAYHLLIDEVERLSCHIKKAIKSRFPDFTSNPEVTNWLETNGLSSHGDTAELMSKLAAFSLLLKLIITESLSDTLSFPSLESYEVADMPSFFMKVNELVSSKLLPHSILDELIQPVCLPIEPSMDKMRKTLELMRTNNEHISDVYNEIIPQKERRKMGQFWTPDYIADFMVDWALRSSNDKLLEPGTGPGIFLLNGMKKLKELGQGKESMHNNLFGVELALVPYLIGTANLVSQLPVAKGNIVFRDFLLFEPPFGSSKRTTIESFTFPWNTLLFDAIVFNPPYTRHHQIPPRYKDEVLERFKKRFGVRISRLSSLFGYFVLQALSFLKTNGRMVFITPTIMFESRNSKILKDFLRKNLQIKAIISFSDNVNVFRGVDTAACITLIENHVKQHEKIALVEVNTWPGKEVILDLLNGSVEGKWEWGQIKGVFFEDLDPDRNWTRIIRSDELPKSDKFTELGKITYIVRGIATGANDFFTLTDDEVEREGIARSFLRPVLTRTRYALGYIFENRDFERLSRKGKKRWLLYLTESDLDQLPPNNVAKYIAKGEREGLNERSLVRTRKKWHLMEKREIPPIIFTYLSRNRARFILNEAGVLALNVFLLVYPSKEIMKDKTKLKAFLAILNSGITRKSLREVGRSYGGNTIKVEPRELDKAVVLNPTELDYKQQEALANLFDELCSKTEGSNEELIKKELDQLILKFAS